MGKRQTASSFFAMFPGTPLYTTRKTGKVDDAPSRNGGDRHGRFCYRPTLADSRHTENGMKLDFAPLAHTLRALRLILLNCKEQEAKVWYNVPKLPRNV